MAFLQQSSERDNISGVHPGCTLASHGETKNSHFWAPSSRFNWSGHLLIFESFPNDSDVQQVEKHQCSNGNFLRTSSLNKNQMFSSLVLSK